MNNLSAQRLRLFKMIYRGAAIGALPGSNLPTNFDAGRKDGAVALVEPTLGHLRSIYSRPGVSKADLELGFVHADDVTRLAGQTRTH